MTVLRMDIGELCGWVVEVYEHEDCWRFYATHDATGRKRSWKVPKKT